MKNIERIVKVSGIVERLDIFLFKGKIAFFVHLSFKSIKLTEKSCRTCRTEGVNPNQTMALVCEIYNMNPSPDSVWYLMPGTQVSFKGVLGADGKRNVLIVSSIITDYESSHV